MTDDIPLLRGVEVHDCKGCHGTGRRERKVCPYCDGRRVVITQRIQPGFVYTKKEPATKRGRGRIPDTGEIG